jgi:DNA replication protein DnaC
MYRRVPRLFDEIALTCADGSYARLLARLAKADLLVLDDLGMGTPTESQRHDLLEVMEDRYGRAGTSSPASSPSVSGTNGSEIPPSPTPSWTASSTTVAAPSR